MGVKVAQKNIYTGKDAEGKPTYKSSEAWWIFIGPRGSARAASLPIRRHLGEMIFAQKDGLRWK